MISCTTFADKAIKVQILLNICNTCVICFDVTYRRIANYTCWIDIGVTNYFNKKTRPVISSYLNICWLSYDVCICNSVYLHALSNMRFECVGWAVLFAWMCFIGFAYLASGDVCLISPQHEELHNAIDSGITPLINEIFNVRKKSKFEKAEKTKEWKTIARGLANRFAADIALGHRFPLRFLIAL